MLLKRIGIVGCCLAQLALVVPAQAFCRSSSCELSEDDTTESCQRDAHHCVTEGNPLHWPSPCLYYAVQRDGSAKSGIDADEFQTAIAQAFAAWASVECPSGGSPRFNAQFQGFVGCDRREAVCGEGKNVNVMMFHDQDWPELSSVIGLTTPTGGTKSGLLVDADLEINSQDFDFGARAAATRAPQLSDVLAHEVGHFLGLAHSDAEGALMSKHYEMLLLSRQLLTADDVAAICTAYPPGQALSCPAPTAPAYDECQVPLGERPSCQLGSVTHDGSSSGCSVVAASGGPRSAGAGSVLSFAAWLWGRRLRAKAKRADGRCSKRS